MKKRFVFLFPLLAICSVSQAAVIGFNVGSSMVSSDVAGPTGARESFWNNAAVSGSNLTWSTNFDSNGQSTATTAVMTFPGPNNAFGSLNSTGVNDGRMLGSFVDLFQGTSSSPNAVMTISNIQHSRYQLLVYNQPNDTDRVAGVQLNNGDMRFMRMLPSGSTPSSGAGYVESFDTTSPGSNGAALSATQAHFVRFDNLSGSTATLDLWGDVAADSVQRFRIAGVQLVADTVDPGGPGSIGTTTLEGTTTGGTAAPLTGARIIRIDQNINDFLQLREVIALEGSTDVATSAEGATITGSPQGHGGNINNSINGIVESGFGSHSASEDINNFERIDLGQSRDLTSVEVLARADCCSSRNANMQLSIYGDTAETNLLYTGALLGMDVSPYSALVDLTSQVGGTKTAMLDPNLTSVMEIDAATGLSDLISVNQGTAALTELVFAGDLEVVLLGGDLENGQTFNLFDADIFSGAFDNIILPDLAALGYPTAAMWDLSQLSTNGSISFVITPEPTAIALWLTIGLGLFLRRRISRR